jgi:hypothetical protein
MSLPGVGDHLRLHVDADERRIRPLRREVREHRAGAAADLHDRSAVRDAPGHGVGDDLDPALVEVTRPLALVLGRRELEVGAHPPWPTRP